MTASMAEVLAQHMLTHDDTCACTCDEMFYDWRLSAEQINVEHSLHVEERLAANGYGKLGLEGGIWTMTDAELKAQLETARIEAAAAVANAVRGPLINLVNALEFTATGTVAERAAGG